jgi:hypothetical protein
MIEDKLYQHILIDPIAKTIFMIIAKARLLSRKELESKESFDKTSVENALGKLENAGLIETRKAATEELDRIYPTGSGLRLEKIVANGW